MFKVGDTVEVIDSSGSGHNDHDIGTIVSFDGVHYWVDDVKGYEQCHRDEHIRLVSAQTEVEEITVDNIRLLDVVKAKRTGCTRIIVSNDDKRESYTMISIGKVPEYYYEVTGKMIASNYTRLYNLHDIHKELNI